MHQSIPAAPSPALPPPPTRRANPRALAFFCLGWQIPGGGDEKRGQMPRPPSTLQNANFVSFFIKVFVV